MLKATTPTYSMAIPTATEEESFKSFAPMGDSGITSLALLEQRINTHRHTGSDLTQPVYVERYLVLRLESSATTATVANAIGGDYVMPFSGYITDVGVTVDTAGTTGTLTLDINKGGTSILSTKITVDSTEKTSRTAATPPVIKTHQFALGSIFTFDVDGIHTTPSTGLTVFLNLVESQHGRTRS